MLADQSTGPNDFGGLKIFRVQMHAPGIMLGLLMQQFP